jgi:hypothetical protein
MDDFKAGVDFEFHNFDNPGKNNPAYSDKVRFHDQAKTIGGRHQTNIEFVTDAISLHRACQVSKAA